MSNYQELNSSIEEHIDNLKELQQLYSEIPAELKAGSRDINSEYRELKRVVEACHKPIDDLMDKTRELRKEISYAETATNILSNNTRKSLRDISKSFSDNFLDIFSGNGDFFKRKFASIVDNANYAIKNQLVKTAFMGDFGDRGENGHKIGGFVGNMLGNSAAKSAIENMFESGDIVKSFTGFLAGTRARGGAVASNRPYLVGENGPEMFIPNSNGQILPNNQSQTSSGVNIIMNITTPDANSFRKSNNQIVADMARAFGKSQRNF